MQYKATSVLTTGNCLPVFPIGSTTLLFIFFSSGPVIIYREGATNWKKKRVRNCLHPFQDRVRPFIHPSPGRFGKGWKDEMRIHNGWKVSAADPGGEGFWQSPPLWTPKVEKEGKVSRL